LGATQAIFSAGATSGANIYVLWTVGNALAIRFDDEFTANVTTTQLFRDPSSWYHLLFAVDTTQATDSNRVKIYVNGSQITAFDTPVYPSQNFDTAMSNNVVHAIGRKSDSADIYLNDYLTEINFIDGQALDPTSFGEFNTDTGVWQPIEYTGTYGTNGFYLDFADNTSTTTLGYDAAGSNDWTLNNFSVTAGAGNDSLVDSPTRYGTDTGAGGEVRGNYATWNPLDKNSNGSLVNGNLDNSNGLQNNAGVRSTFALPESNKWYAELRVNSNTSSTVALGFGFATSTADLAGSVDSANKYVIYGSNTGSIFSNTSSITGSLGAFSSGDILQIAYDGATGKAWLGKNNTWYNSSGGTTGDPGSGTNETFTLTGQMFLFSYYYNVSGSLNCGQRPFEYTAPSGFKALVTTNLPTPTIEDGGEYFNTVLYTGTGSSLGVTGVGFQPDLVWIKERSGAADHGLYDVLRGVQNQLESNTTTAETAEATGLTAFGSDGFTVGALAQLNTNTDTYVAWNWKANGAGVSNTAGTITSTVSVNTTSGFSIVTYTGTGSAATVGHGLGVAPAMIIVKNRDAADAWQVYHAANTANPETDYLVLNTTAATADNANRWNDTLPTSTVFSIGDGVEVNTNTEDYVAYVFAQIAGYSAFGSYTGNGSANGPFVYTGFRPAYLVVKRTNSTGNWLLHDSSRSPSNVSIAELYLSASESEYTGANGMQVDFVANGFKLRSTVASNNASGGTYIYMAFAENPFSIALAR
jgi:hypothetical protein